MTQRNKIRAQKTITSVKSAISEKERERMGSNSRFVDRSASVEVTLKDGAKIQVRQRLTAREEASLNRNLVRLRFDPEAGKVVADEGDWHLQQIGIVKSYLIDWDFTNGTGEAVPFTQEGIDLLDTETVAEISAAISRLQQLRNEERAKNA